MKTSDLSCRNKKLQTIIQQICGLLLVTLMFSACANEGKKVTENNEISQNTNSLQMLDPNNPHFSDWSNGNVDNTISEPMKGSLILSNENVKVIHPIYDLSFLGVGIADSLRKLEESLVQIADAGSLSAYDHGFLVSDIRDVRVVQFDWRDGSTRIIGGVGQGPGEYMRPRGVSVNSEGDTVIVYDTNLHRYTIFVSDAVDSTIVSSRVSGFNDILYHSNKIYLNAPTIDSPKITSVPLRSGMPVFNSHLSEVKENWPFTGPSEVATIYNNTCVLATMNNNAILCVHEEMNRMTIYRSSDLSFAYDLELKGAAIDTILDAKRDIIMQRRRENTVPFTFHIFSVISDILVAKDNLYFLTAVPEIHHFDSELNQIGAYRIEWENPSEHERGVNAFYLLGMPQDGVLLIMELGTNKIYAVKLY
jgi:hypothetical protein